MERRELFERVRTAVGNIKEEAMNLACSPEGSANTFDCIVNINNRLEEIYECMIGLEQDAERAEKIASELRKKWGEQLSKECDAAGIK